MTPILITGYPGRDPIKMRSLDDPIRADGVLAYELSGRHPDRKTRDIPFSELLRNTIRCLRWTDLETGVELAIPQISFFYMDLGNRISPLGSEGRVCAPTAINLSEEEHSFQSGRGPMKSIMNRYQTVWTDRIYAVGYGDAERCRDILQHVNAIGSDRKGQRNVSYWEVEEIDTEHHAIGLVDSAGVPVRALPYTFWASLNEDARVDPRMVRMSERIGGVRWKADDSPRINMVRPRKAQVKTLNDKVRLGGFDVRN